jgi:hypothetical protein
MTACSWIMYSEENFWDQLRFSEIWNYSFENISKKSDFILIDTQNLKNK